MEKENHGVIIPSVQQENENSAPPMIAAPPVNLRLSLGGSCDQNLSATLGPEMRIMTLRAFKEMARNKPNMELGQTSSANTELMQQRQQALESPGENHETVVQAAAAAASSSTNIASATLFLNHEVPEPEPTSARICHYCNPWPPAFIRRPSRMPRFTMNDGTLEVVSEDEELLKEMPTLITKGGHPNGKEVKGFLFQYGIGVEIIIVCLCHGLLLSPTGFYMHAGGSHDLGRSLKHIYLAPPPSD